MGRTPYVPLMLVLVIRNPLGCSSTVPSFSDISSASSRCQQEMVFPCRKSCVCMSSFAIFFQANRYPRQALHWGIVLLQKVSYRRWELLHLVTGFQVPVDSFPAQVLQGGHVGRQRSREEQRYLLTT